VIDMPFEVGDAEPPGTATTAIPCIM
jgi:hypothetical protein